MKKFLYPASFVLPFLAHADGSQELADYLNQLDFTRQNGRKAVAFVDDALGEKG